MRHVIQHQATIGPATIYHGDCLEILPVLPEASFTACVTDPPYGLEFMGKCWDRGVPGVEYWEAVLRVLKPGAMLLAFGGTRTFHRLTTAIEDAGFEIRDCLMWLYGSGFPKSLGIAKSIDKSGLEGGSHVAARRDLANEIRRAREAAGISRKTLASWFPYSEVTKNWERLDKGFRIPTTSDFEVLVERLGVDPSYREMVRAEDARQVVSEDGTDRRGDGTVYALAHAGCTYQATTETARRWEGYGTTLKPAFEPIILAMKPLDGTFATNALEHGVAGLNVDCCRIPAPGGGRFPANVILDEEAGKILDAQTGILTSGKPCGVKKAKNNVYGQYGTGIPVSGFGDSGGASRFFYCAKASKKDRTCNGSVGNKHPTVKPRSLMEYLCRLVTPPGGGVILDPFMGSGSTGLGAIAAGNEFVGIELEKESFDTAKARLRAEYGSDARRR